MSNEELKTEKKPTTALNWETKESRRESKGEGWYWTIATGGLFLVIVSILMKNFLLTAFVVFASVTVALEGARKPQILKYSIGARGARIGDKLYPYSSLDSFWISYDPPHKKEIVIKSKKILASHLAMPLGDIDPNSARNLLVCFLKEEKHEETMSEIIADIIGL